MLSYLAKDNQGRKVPKDVRTPLRQGDELAFSPINGDKDDLRSYTLF